MLDGNEERYVLDALRSGWISSAGEYLDRFEKAFAKWCGVEYGVACSSGTAALHLACAALGIGSGDEVILSNFTLAACANMVILAGARPVFVDADPKTWCMDAARIEPRITPRTKAIMAVHMYGHPCDMERISDVARRRGLAVIEDCAEAHGAEFGNRKVGTIGDVGCFSFYGNKILTTGEGGMLVTARKDVAERARLLRNQAFEEPRFVHHSFGFNYRLTNLQAAMGLAQCETLDRKVEAKRNIAAAYTRRLRGQRDITLPYEAPGCKSVYWMYGVLLGDSFGPDKSRAMELLKRKGIETRSFFHPLHRQPVYVTGRDPRFPDIRGEYPVSDMLYQRGLYLPSGIGLTEAQVDEVVRKLLECRE